MALHKQYNEQEKNAIFNDICEKVILHKMSFNQAVEESEISLVSFYKWIVDSEERKELYNYARNIRSDVLFEEIIEIADTPEEGEVTTEKASGIEIKRGDMTEHRRLKVDARKWVVARMNPKKYGDKLDLSTNGEKINQTPNINLVLEGKPVDLSLSSIRKTEE